MNIDQAANLIAPIAKRNQDVVRFRDTNATCPNCAETLDYYYCENRTYAIRCPHCQTVTLVQAGSPAEAAARVGIIAIPLNEWNEDDGTVLCFHFPVKDDCDVCLAYPLAEPSEIPDGFTHFVNLPSPLDPTEKGDTDCENS